jgi:hypothetical protein
MTTLVTAQVIYTIRRDELLVYGESIDTLYTDKTGKESRQTEHRAIPKNPNGWKIEKHGRSGRFSSTADYEYPVLETEIPNVLEQHKSDWKLVKTEEYEEQDGEITQRTRTYTLQPLTDNAETAEIIDEWYFEMGHGETTLDIVVNGRRIHTLDIPVEEFIGQLKREGWKVLTSDKTSEGNFRATTTRTVTRLTRKRNRK